MDSLAIDFASGTFNRASPPCLSLYQPTHRSHPQNRQDVIRFRNLVKTIGKSLERRYSKQDVASLLEPLHALAGDREFWAHARDGLAVLESSEAFRVYRLQRPVAEAAYYAVAGRIATVLIDADRHIPGRVNGATGYIETDRRLSDPATDDLLDDIGEWVLKNRGQVVIAPSDHMPTDTGIAAIYRY